MIRLNWGMLHLTFVLQTLKWSIWVCECQWEGRVWDEVGGREPVLRQRRAENAGILSLSEEPQSLMALSPTDSDGHHLLITHLPQNDKIDVHLTCSF